jgi:hypothetical protein
MGGRKSLPPNPSFAPPAEMQLGFRKVIIQKGKE